MTTATATFPIDIGSYKPLSLDPANPILTDEQRQTLKANIQLCRDTIIFFTATGAARGVGGHTGGPCLLYTSPSPRDAIPSRMPSSA